MLTLNKFEEASEKVKEVTLETKLIYSEFLSEATGNKVYLKPENMQLTGAYKVRGAYYKISTLTEEERSDLDFLEKQAEWEMYEYLKYQWQEVDIMGYDMSDYVQVNERIEK